MDAIGICEVFSSSQTMTTVNVCRYTTLRDATGHHVLAPPKDIREVQNACEAYDVAATFDPYSLDDLLKAHKLMMGGLVKRPGYLRNENVGVYAGGRPHPPGHSCQLRAAGHGRSI